MQRVLALYVCTQRFGLSSIKRARLSCDQNEKCQVPTMGTWQWISGNSRGHDDLLKLQSGGHLDHLVRLGQNLAACHRTIEVGSPKVGANHICQVVILTTWQPRPQREVCSEESMVNRHLVTMTTQKAQSIFKGIENRKLICSPAYAVHSSALLGTMNTVPGSMGDRTDQRNTRRNRKNDRPVLWTGLHAHRFNLRDQRQ